VTTIINGINNEQVGRIVEFALDNPKKISFLSFQPVSFTGRDEEISDERRAAQRYTLADLAHGLLRCLRGEPVVSPPVLRSLIARYRKPKPPGLSEILSPAELRVIELGAAGHDCKTVASLLGLSVATVYVHNKRIAKKLGVPNRLAAIVKFKESGGSASAHIAPDPATD
jgi:DNA-binding CsgD family transcriptional regulator